MSWFTAYQLLVSFTEFFIVYIFFKSFIGNRKFKSTLVYILSSLICVALAILLSTNEEIGAFKVVAVIAIFVGFSFLFEGNLKIKLFSGFLFYIFIMLSDAVAMYGTCWLSDVSLSELFENVNLLIVSSIISKFILFIIVKSVCAFRQKANTRLPLLYWIALAAIPLISCFALYLFYSTTYSENSTETSPYLFLLSLGLIFINGVTFQLFESLLEKTALEMREKLKDQHIEAQISQYEAIISEQQSRRRFRHDLKNNIEMIHNLIESGNASEALDSMKRLVDISAIDKEYVHTGNAVIDAIFNAKIRLAESKGVRVEIDNIIVPSDLSISSNDMCILFTNSFDNAIEACDRLSEGEKKITIGLMRRDENLVYKITNPTDGKLVKGKRHFLTSKQDEDMHGIGIESMEKTLEKYDGLLSLTHNDNVFELVFVIPCM